MAKELEKRSEVEQEARWLAAQEELYEMDKEEAAAADAAEKDAKARRRRKMWRAVAVARERERQRAARAAEKGQLVRRGEFLGFGVQQQVGGRPLDILVGMTPKESTLDVTRLLDIARMRNTRDGKQMVGVARPAPRIRPPVVQQFGNLKRSACAAGHCARRWSA